MITFSIVIPTFKRKKYLLQLLDSLKGKIGHETEIIVVEQGENNGKDYIKRAKKLRFALSYFFLEKPSTPRAKNIGANKARGKYIIFFDDDVVVKTSPLQYAECFTTSNIAAVNGRSLAKGQKPQPKRTDVGKIVGLGKFTDGYSSKILQEIQTVIGCNVCWDKKIFQKLGGFDEQFQGNAFREEADLSLRAREKGYKIFFDPRVEIFHDRAEYGGTRKTEGRIQWYFDFFSNETYFFLKHFSFWLVPFIMCTRIEWALRCMLGFGREVSTRSMVTPLVGYFDGYMKYLKWKKGPLDSFTSNGLNLKIGVDAGCLGVKDDGLKVGVYHIVKNVLIHLSKLDKENTYFLYSFYPIDKQTMSLFGKNMKNIVVRPTRGWMKLWLPLRLARDKVDVLVAANQAMPLKLPFSTYKTVGIIYDIAFEKYPELYAYAASVAKHSSFSKSLAKHAEKIIAISQTTKKDLEKIYAVAKKDIIVSYPGIVPLPKVKPHKEAYPYFLYVGAFKKGKNVPTLLKAYKKFRESTRKKILLLMAGGNKWLDPAIVKVFESMPMSIRKDIHLLGAITSSGKLSSLYRGSLAFISPSLYEGFGLPFAEAMSVGCPVIGSTRGSIPEVVGEAGMLTGPFDVSALTNSMKKIWIHKKIRDACIQKGKQQVKKYSWKTFAKAVQFAIEQVV